MQFQEALKLQAQWEAKGNPPCEHPKIVREVHFSGHTGDAVCTTCGYSRWRKPSESTTS